MQQNRSNTKGHSRRVHFYGIPQIDSAIEVESRLVVAKGGGKAGMEKYTKKHKVSFSYNKF